jgi:hypothetical protein
LSEDNRNRKRGAGHNNSKKRKDFRWLITLFIVTIFVSITMSSVSAVLIQKINFFAALIVLVGIIALGVVFDIIGIAVAVADEIPFHAMASRKVKGAKNAIKLIKNASKIATFCNDVIGDVCGVISGSASAFIALRVSHTIATIDVATGGIIIGAFAAGLTVIGKGFGKTLALSKSTEIVYQVALLQYYVTNSFSLGMKKK